MGEHTSRVEIACCPKHGLHGDRHECFVCGGAVERIPMVPAAVADALRDVLAWFDRIGIESAIADRNVFNRARDVLGDARDA